MPPRPGSAARRRRCAARSSATSSGSSPTTIATPSTRPPSISSRSRPWRCSPDEVVGTVRIHQPEPGIWYGSRLAVDSRYRRVGALGAALVRLAVSSATSLGCVRFYAHVQAQNELMFRRLDWSRVDTLDLHGVPHVFMQANLGRLSAARQCVGRVSRAGQTGRGLMSGRFSPTPRLPDLAAHIRAARGMAHKTDIAGVVAALGLAQPGPIAIGDDCAAIPDGDGFLLFAIEGFVNDFVAADPRFAGYCGVMVNLSDIAAMGGRPIAVVDAIWSKGAAAATPVLEGLARSGRRLRRPDRRRPYQYAQRSRPARGRRSRPRQDARHEFRGPRRRRADRGARPCVERSAGRPCTGTRAAARRPNDCAATSPSCRSSRKRAS